jgi:hypothetical protein
MIKSMIAIFHENVLFLSTYKFIVIPIQYRYFGAFVYDSAEKQMLSAITLVIEQRKSKFDRIANSSCSTCDNRRIVNPLISHE